MDGLSATRRIREQETDQGGHIPIIAMTAHAMKGDREACLDAGMDEYVPKPIRTATLVEKLVEVLQFDQKPSCETPDLKSRDQADDPNDQSERNFTNDTDAASQSPMFQQIDWEQLHETVGDSQELIIDLFEAFTTESCSLKESICKAVEVRDAKLLQSSAHTLKGAAMAIGAVQLAECSKVLELKGCKQDIDDVSDALEQLDEALTATLKDTSDYLTQHA
ncbi:MAG: response regulator [Pirellulaceae bacterium]